MSQTPYTPEICSKWPAPCLKEIQYSSRPMIFGIYFQKFPGSIGNYICICITYQWKLVDICHSSMRISHKGSLQDRKTHRTQKFQSAQFSPTESTAGGEPAVSWRRKPRERTVGGGGVGWMSLGGFYRCCGFFFTGCTMQGGPRRRSLIMARFYCPKING